MNVKVNVFQGDEKKHNFDVAGSSRDVGRLAAEIVRETEKRLDSNTP